MNVPRWLAPVLLLILPLPARRAELEIWTPALFDKRATPRDVKRFINWLRYLAMRSGALKGANVSEEDLVAYVSKHQAISRDGVGNSSAIERAEQLYRAHFHREILAASDLPEAIREILASSRAL